MKNKNIHTVSNASTSASDSKTNNMKDAHMNNNQKSATIINIAEKHDSLDQSSNAMAQSDSHSDIYFNESMGGSALPKIRRLGDRIGSQAKKTRAKNSRVAATAMADGRLMRSPAGLRLLLGITELADLRDYADIFSPTADELANLGANKDSFDHYGTIIAVGVWAQNTREEIANGLVTGEAAALGAAESDRAFELLGNTSAFKAGRNKARHLWLSHDPDAAALLSETSEADHRAGRKNKNHAERLFLTTQVAKKA